MANIDVQYSVTSMAVTVSPGESFIKKSGNKVINSYILIRASANKAAFIDIKKGEPVGGIFDLTWTEDLDEDEQGLGTYTANLDDIVVELGYADIGAMLDDDIAFDESFRVRRILNNMA